MDENEIENHYAAPESNLEISKTSGDSSVSQGTIFSLSETRTWVRLLAITLIVWTLISAYEIFQSISTTGTAISMGRTLISVDDRVILNVVIGAASSPANGQGVTVDVNDVPSPDVITVKVPRTNTTTGKIFGRLLGTRP